MHAINSMTRGSEIVWEEVLAEMQGHIGSRPAAKSALDRMVNLGCDRQTILRRLYMYCGGTPDMVRVTKGEFRRKWRSVLKVSKQLREMAANINKARDILADAGFVVSSPRTCEIILAEAEFLEQLANTFLKDLASDRVTGRDHHLKFLAEMFERITGRPHYGQLADLTGAVRQGYTGDPGEATAEDIRQRVKRYGALDVASAAELASFT
jgi:hypothetical protein